MTQLPRLIIALVLLFAVVAALWAVTVMLERRKRRTPAKADLCFRSCDRLLSPAEASFYAALRIALEHLGADHQPLVFAKVRLADILRPDRAGDSRSANQSRWNRISQKHADFILCDPGTTRPLLVIELDDVSHARADRAERDCFVNRACESARLPILHVRAAARYAPADLARRIREMGVVMSTVSR